MPGPGIAAQGGSVVMHVQARVSTKGSGFPDDDVEDGEAVSATYRPGVVSEILGILADGGFNLRTAGGRRIELGGEFAFAVRARDGDANHEDATHAAVDLLKESGFDAWVVEVQTQLLGDDRGTLRSFVDDIRDSGLLIDEIAVGTPAEDGLIPVQIHTVRIVGAAQD